MDRETRERMETVLDGVIGVAREVVESEGRMMYAIMEDSTGYVFGVYDNYQMAKRSMISGRPGRSLHKVVILDKGPAK